MTEAITSVRDITSNQAESNSEISFTSSEASNDNILNDVTKDKNICDDSYIDQKENPRLLTRLPLISGILFFLN